MAGDSSGSGGRVVGPDENRLIFSFFGGGTDEASLSSGGFCGAEWEAIDAVCVLLGPGVPMALALFFFLFRATDSGLNIIGFPVVATDADPNVGVPFSSSMNAGLGIEFGIPVSSAVLPPSSVNSSRSSWSASLLNAGSAPVFRLKTFRAGALLPVPFAPGGLLAVVSLFGGGSIALKPANAPAPTRGLFAGGSSSWLSVEVCDGKESVRLMRIFLGLDLSTAKFVLCAVGAGPDGWAEMCFEGGAGVLSVSEPSESEYDTSIMVNVSCRFTSAVDRSSSVV